MDAGREAGIGGAGWVAGKGFLKRFYSLDAMRGIAALLVVFWHSGGLGPLAPHFAYLSVDLFFMLSGFVLAYTYDPRFDRGMTAGAFMVRRIKRLLPLYLAGLLVGLAMARLPGSMSFAYSAGLLRSQPANLLLLPAIPTWATDTLFPTNNALWSLFFEYWVGNLIYAIGWRFLRGRALVALVASSACLLVWAQFHFGKIDVGISWSTILGGLARILFSYFMGVLLLRLWNARGTPVSVPAWLLLLVLVVALWLPSTGSSARVHELACVLVLFPALVYFGAGAAERRPRLGQLLGNASFAVYVLHWPLVVAAILVMGRLGIMPSAALQIGFVSFVAVLGLTAEMAYDRPASRFLKR